MAATQEELKAKVVGIQPGNPVRATFADPAGTWDLTITAVPTFSEHGAVWFDGIETGDPRAAEKHIIRFDDGYPGTRLYDVEILSKPFYANMLANRNHRKGDVARIARSDVPAGGWTFHRGDEFVFNGRVWFATQDVDEPRIFAGRPFNFRPGELALVDPSELEVSL